MGQTIGERMNEWMERRFVGRRFECGVFEQLLSSIHSRTERIINVIGTAGMGKTTLLERYEALALEHGAQPLRVDIAETGSGAERIWQAICDGLETGLERQAPASFEACVNAIHRKSENVPLVLLVDGYEKIGSSDYWFRTVFLPRLPMNILIVIAGRYSLEGPWRHSPAWKPLIIRLPLTELSYEDIQGYLKEAGETSDEAVDSVWFRTMGHPLSLSLLSLSDGEERTEQPFVSFEDRLEVWLKEAPDEELRELLFAASITRSFHQEWLAALLDKDVPSTWFERLSRLSFVARAGEGWQLHERVWEAMRRTFRERKPDTFERYCRKAVERYFAKIDEGIRLGQDISREFAEVLRFAGNPVMRAHYRHARESRHYMEPVDAGNREEAAAYAVRRRAAARPLTIRCADLETGALFRYSLSAEESLLRLNALPIDELLEECPGSLKLIRNAGGLVVGLTALVPIHEGTIDYLTRAPLSRAYFQSLTPAGRQELRVPPERSSAIFVYSIDVADYEDEELRGDIIPILFEPLLSGSLLVQSPPPLPYFAQACESLGFEETPGARHAGYGEERIARTYTLDTRKNGLQTYLRRMISNAGTRAAAEVPNERQPAVARLPERLTAREQEVALHLTQGLTNPEIAARLYVSEAAIKKHVNAMLSKFHLKNRTQLAKLILDASSPDPFPS